MNPSNGLEVAATTPSVGATTRVPLQMAMESAIPRRSFAACLIKPSSTLTIAKKHVKIIPWTRG